MGESFSSHPIFFNCFLSWHLLYIHPREPKSLSPSTCFLYISLGALFNSVTSSKGWQCHVRNQVRAFVWVCRLWWWWLVLSWGEGLGAEQERWKREGPAWILGFLSPHQPSSLNLFVPQDSSFLLLGIPVALASPWWCLHWQGFVREPVSIV